MSLDQDLSILLVDVSHQCHRLQCFLFMTHCCFAQCSQVFVHLVLQLPESTLKSAARWALRHLRRSYILCAFVLCIRFENISYIWNNHSPLCQIRWCWMHAYSFSPTHHRNTEQLWMRDDSAASCVLGKFFLLCASPARHRLHTHKQQWDSVKNKSLSCHLVLFRSPEV